MTPKKKKTSSSSSISRGTGAFLESFIKKKGKIKALRTGSIVLRLTGPAGGEFCLDCSERGVRLTKGLPKRPLQFEVMGDTKRIQAILEGKKDARKEFLSGGIRLRGDLRHFSDLAMELGIIKEPL